MSDSRDLGEDCSPSGQGGGSVSWSMSSAGIRIDVRGDLTACHRDGLRAAVRAVSRHRGPVVVDLAGVTDVGDAGLAFLTRLAAFEMRSGRRLALLDTPATVMGFLAARHTNRLFELA